MEEEFDFEEAARLCDKNISMMYYDEAVLGRNFIIKIRKLLKNRHLSPDELKVEVGRLNSKLKVHQKKFLEKHLRLYSQ
jgi:hypothetical protein